MEFVSKYCTVSTIYLEILDEENIEIKNTVEHNDWTGEANSICFVFLSRKSHTISKNYYKWLKVFFQLLLITILRTKLFGARDQILCRRVYLEAHMEILLLGKEGSR